MKLSAKNARELWKALMANAACLVRDAELLLRSGSFGRAWSLSACSGRVGHDFGDDQESWERIWQERRQKAEVAAKEANLLKQRGFYVDQGTGGSIQSSAGIEQGTLVQDLQTAAQVIEMLLIKDHTRMKHFSAEPYDGTHSTQFNLHGVVGVGADGAGIGGHGLPQGTVPVLAFTVRGRKRLVLFRPVLIVPRLPPGVFNLKSATKYRGQKIR